MKRTGQIILIVTFLAFSWLAMQAVHESGHVLGAVVTGGAVSRVVLYPFEFSRTDLSRNPHPLLVVWAGPLAGIVLPLLAFVAARCLRWPGVYLFRFFAGFCLIANGVYIAFGPSEGGADTGVMLLHGTPRWTMMAFGILSALLGLSLWHRQGPHFGLGEAKGRVDGRAVITSAALFAAITLSELIVNSR